jgi:hypothetical protein
MNVLKLLLHTPPYKILRLVARKFSDRSQLHSFSDNHPCIFVLSTGRVGSMTLAALFSDSDDLMVHHEPYPRLFGASKAYYQYAEISPESLWELIWSSLREDLLSEALREGRGYLETSPQATFLVPLIASLLPSSRFIHLVRHPLDVVMSGVRRNWYGGHGSDRTRIEPRQCDPFAAQWPQMTVIQKNIWLWYETNRWIIERMKELPSDRCLRVVSEDVFRGDNAVLARIAEFCGTQPPEASRVRRVLDGRLNRQTTGEATAFSNWSDNEKQFAGEILNDISESLGYTLMDFGPKGGI